MTPLRQTNFRLEEEILEALQAIRERDGIPVAEQVRRALQAWIAEKGVRKTAKRSAPTPRRKA